MAKSIDDYKKDYEKAKAAGDAKGMKAANDGANAIRASKGEAAQVASKDIASVAAQSAAKQATQTASSASAAAKSGGSTSKSSGGSSSKSSGGSSIPAGSKTDNYYDQYGNVLGQYYSNGQGTAYDTKTGEWLRDMFGHDNVNWTQYDKPNEQGFWGGITVNTPSGGGGGGSYSGGGSVGSTGWTPTRSGLRDASDIARTFGDINYDEKAIRALFDAASDKKYDLLNKEYTMSENKYYDALAGTGSTALDTLRRNSNAAIATGASKGMQAATELSSMLGLEQQGIEDATALTQERNKLMDKHAAEVAQNAIEAMQYANQTKFNMGNLSANFYAADSQFDVGQMDYYARLDTAEKALQGQIALANAQKYAAELGLSGAEYNAFMNLVGNAYGSNMNYQGSLGVADINRAGQQYAADRNLEGTKYNADVYARNAGVGGYGGQHSQNLPQIEDAINNALATRNKAGFLALVVSSGYSEAGALALWDELTNANVPGTDPNNPHSWDIAPRTGLSPLEILRQKFGSGFLNRKTGNW